MKKLLLAITALAVLFASCSKEENPGTVVGESALVTFALSTDHLASKAVGDGISAADLYYAVYDAAGDMVGQISKVDDPVQMNNLKAEVKLTLLNGEYYSLIFWAQNEETPCTIDWDAKTMTYNPTVANQEAYDAFFASVPQFKVTGDKTETVKLTRPFAQLNIATTDDDLDELKNYFNNGDYTVAKVTVENVPNVLNLVTGEATGSQTMVYDYANISLLDNEVSPAAGYDQYIAMNYVLVSTSQVAKVTLDINTAADAANVVSRTFENVPVKRNYKTNIFGDLYASTFNFDVEILPDFATPNYTIWSGVINLTEDLEITEPIVIAKDNEAIVNLNGHKIVNKITQNYKGDVFKVRGKLTIKGEGVIDAANCAIFATDNAEVNIYGGTFIGSNTTDGATEVVHSAKSSTVNIYGGTFEAISPSNGLYWVLNLKDSQNGAINVYGGTFVNFDPSDGGTEDPAKNFVAAGYKATQVGQNWIVTKEDVDVVTDAAGINAAVAAGHKAVLASDVTLEQPITLSKDLNLDLNGYTLNANVASGRAFDIDGIGVNLTINAEGSQVVFGNGTYGIVQLKAGAIAANVTINGGNFVGETNEGAFVRMRDGNKECVVTLNNVNYVDNCGVNEAAIPNAFIVSTATGSDEPTQSNNKIIVNGGSYKAAAGFGVTVATELNGVSIETRGLAVEQAAETAVIKNCTIVSENSTVGSAPAAGIAVSSNGKVVVSSSEITSQGAALYIYSSGGAIEATGCTLNANPVYNWILDQVNYPDAFAKITIDGVVKVDEN